ncbi:MAG: aminotransferase class V-fold PLP-dependent enzyme, partial [Anaerovoracaceae bacterium]
PDALRQFLKENHDFKYATLVHMDTPSGVLNPVELLCPILKEYGILTVVDSVAGMFGEPISAREAQIDILCGGSQKALSAPPGLTIVGVSPEAFTAMEERTTPIAAFYANLLTFKDYYKNQWFPYTMPISDIEGLGVAVENLLADPDIFSRHAQVAAATRTALTNAGLKLYLNSGYSNNVTVICVPEGRQDTEILSTMRDKYGIMIAGCFDVLAGKVIRIGHMGESANEEAVRETLSALGKTLGIEIKY